MMKEKLSFKNNDITVYGNEPLQIVFMKRVHNADIKVPF
jgi:hypothetical protein